MIIDKVIEYANEKELQELESQGLNTYVKYCELLEILKNEFGGKSKAKDKKIISEKLIGAMGEYLKLHRGLELKYCDAVKDNPSKIYSDAEEILNSISKEDFEKYVKEGFKKQENPIGKISFHIINLANAAQNEINTFEGCRQSLTFLLSAQSHALYYVNKPEITIALMAAIRAAELYDRPQEDIDKLRKILKGVMLTAATDAEILEKLTQEDTELINRYVNNVIKKIEPPETDPEAAEENKADIDIINFFEQGTNTLEYPIDKPNNSIWNEFIMAAAIPNAAGQITIAMEKDGDKPLNLLYSINFDNLEETGVTITKKLTAYDKRVYIACGALFAAGYDIITIGQIYKTMGNSGKPSATAIKKINDSLTKMRGATIFIDNEQESKAYKYPHFRYDASLLPMERITAIINGQETGSAIKLYREPPLLSFAKQRKQVTTVKRELLASPINKTELNLSIDDYLIERISHIKNSKGKTSNRILFDKIFKTTGIKDRRIKPKKRQDIIEKLLPHYKKQGFIKDFTADNDGITIKY